MRRPLSLPPALADVITASVVTIGGLMSDAFRLRLAWFQRAYAWTEDHALLLLDGLEEAMDADREAHRWHNLGTIILVQAKGSTDAVLADGQQRVLTLTILVALLRDLAASAAEREALHDWIWSKPTRDEQDGHFRFRPHASSEAVLRHYVQSLGATSIGIDDTDERELSVSDSNIVANRDALKARLMEMSAERRMKLAHFLGERCCLVIQTMRSEEDAKTAFSLAHSTGVRLVQADIFKADTLSALPGRHRSSAAKIWEHWQARLGPDRFEELLRAMLAIERGRFTKPRQLYDDLETSFRLDVQDRADAFVRERLPKAASLFEGLTRWTLGDGDPAWAPVNRRLQYLSWVSHRTWLPVAMALASRLPGEPGRLLDGLVGLDRLAYALMIVGSDGVAQQRRYAPLLASDADPAEALAVTADEQRQVRRVLESSRVIRPRLKVWILLRVNGALEGDAA